MALDHDTMQQEIFAAAVGKNIAGILFIGDCRAPGFLKKEERLEPVADTKALVDDHYALRGGKTLINTPGAKAALQLILDMLDADKTTSLNFPNPCAAFLKGIAAMQLKETVSIRACAPTGAPDLKWGMALPPVPKAGDKAATNLDGWMDAVPNLSKNKADAWMLIEWLNGAEKDFEICKKYNASPRYTLS